MDDPNAYEVTKIETHYLPLCACEACVQERERRSQVDDPTPLHVKHISPAVAFLLGHIETRNPHGSLARELMQDQS